jgi:glutamate decarboxylase
MTEHEVLAVRPNVVMSACYQAAWEKLFRYFDVEPKLVKPNLQHGKMAIDAEDIAALVDEKTICVVGILGNHYNGAYDPVWDIDAELTRLNEENGWQVGMHVDAASGGFIAPFQEMSGLPTPRPFDFRLPNVLTMSTSGHKFGESICGTGWIVFRQREDLAEHIAVTVTYLGGTSDSMTLNFSRPASGPYVQFYKLLRLGTEGYQQKTENQMKVAKYLRDYIKSQVHEPSGKPRFQMLDGGDTCCLPVVAARLNPELGLHYNDIDIQHAMSESHWYVSGYSLGFENPSNGKFESLFTDVNEKDTMFRIVVKSNLTQSLAEDLVDKFDKVIKLLDTLDGGYEALRSKVAGLEAVVEEEEDEMAAAGIGDRRLAMKHGKAKSWKSTKRGSLFSSQHIC